ncbi:MAG TPA: 16S rRNA (cytidine(1402)-2'-O)-methyltransferase, partial [Candidatus Polarisedimenticolia bacterium]|nr:16S rRNA (cytidine(1402)-2'-O)-methyltransferase [Candidatus Polarisedimenticolia bacterium]
MPPGTLLVVATPLGNLEDLSPRAAQALGSAALVACEDTRRTRGLLESRGIRARRLVSYHKFNERRQVEPILSVLRQGGDVALVSDGGTPGVSDPGAIVVDAALDEGLPVSPIPGPSAAAAAVSASGLVSGPFLFAGFLPARGKPRREALAELAGQTRPIVLFEAPHRLEATLRDLIDALGDRRATLVREATKLHEEVRRAALSSFLEGAAARPPRGEH